MYFMSLSNIQKLVISSVLMSMSDVIIFLGGGAPDPPLLGGRVSAQRSSAPSLHVACTQQCHTIKARIFDKSFNHL